MKIYFLLILFFFIEHLAAAGKIYRHEDTQGRVTYSNQPAYTGKQTKRSNHPNRYKSSKSGGMATKVLSPFGFIARMAAAESIYRHEDAQGRITYSDQPAYTGKQTQIATKPYRSLYRVKRVYDGDTISLKNGQRVRLLGINTPEVEGRHKNSEPGGIAAKEWLQQQLEDGQVYLEFDEEKQDRYKRLLAHLYLPDSTHLNIALVENGMAVVNLIPPNLNHADKLIQAQNKAQKEKLGIWSRPEYAPKPLTAITKKYFGWNRYTGTPTSIKKSRKYSRLVFNDKTDIRIANKNLHLFPKLNTYLDKSLEIHGRISRQKNRYSILIQHPSALILH